MSHRHRSSKLASVALVLFVLLSLGACAVPSGGSAPSSTTVETPSINPSSGSISTATAISISCPTVGATIAYTTDGTTPTISSGAIAHGNQYSSSFSLPMGLSSVKAIAFKTGMTDSPTASAAFNVTKAIVYAVGYYVDSSNKAAPCYWQDASKVNLDCGPLGGQAYAASISNGGLVAAGINAAALTTPCYWVNNVRKDLPYGTCNANAIAIQIANGKTYLAGNYYVGTVSTAYYSVDGQDHSLPAPTNGNSSMASAMFVSGTTVYVAGYYWDGAKNVPCYWVDGIEVNLPTAGRPRRLCLWHHGFDRKGLHSRQVL